MSMSKHFQVLLAVSPVIALAAMLSPSVYAGGPSNSATIAVSGTQWGTSTQYIGANEGDQYFNTNDMTNLGINSYRIYGGMSRWEPSNWESTYGSPTIDQIKANPSVINWTAVDSAFNNPPGGSDYSWSGDSNVAPVSASTIFSQLKATGIKPVVVLRNVDNNNNPSWAPNPPTTQADWNVWWEFVFATVYELDVRNNYGVDDWEVHNEPNNKSQGWAGTEAQYEQFVQETADAINYVYQTYLPGRTPHIYAPATTGGSSWPNDMLQTVGTDFNTMDVHDYSSNVSGYVQQVHGWLSSDGYPNMPLWLTEWGTYRGSYGSETFDVGLINNLISMSEPGNNYVTGSEIFSLYNWGANNYGLIGSGDVPGLGYYAMRLGIRGLQGGRPTYQSTTSNSNLVAITTKDSSGNIYLLVTNGSSQSYTVNADLSQLGATGTGTQWEFSSAHSDTVVGNPTVSNGHVTLNIPGNAAELVEVP